MNVSTQETNEPRIAFGSGNIDSPYQAGVHINYQRFKERIVEKAQISPDPDNAFYIKLRRPMSDIDADDTQFALTIRRFKDTNQKRYLVQVVGQYEGDKLVNPVENPERDDELQKLFKSKHEKESVISFARDLQAKLNQKTSSKK